MTKEGLFSQFVEPGRFSLIRYGPLAGKTCTIVDMVGFFGFFWEGQRGLRVVVLGGTTDLLLGMVIKSRGGRRDGEWSTSPTGESGD